MSRPGPACRTVLVRERRRCNIVSTLRVPFLEDPAPPSPSSSVSHIMSLRAITRWSVGIALFAWSSTALAVDGVPAPSVSLVDELAPIASDRMFRDADVAWQVVHVDSGEEVYAWGDDKALNPASTMKVLTAASALHHLGPSYRFSTELYTDGEIDASGVLRGNLYVQGHGDPTLVVERLWKLMVDLKLEGVERVAGDVVFDESWLSTDYQLPGWDKREDIERGPSYFPALSALSLNFNTVALVVGPGGEVGEPARLQLETPASGYVILDNQLTTGAQGSRRWLRIEREIVEEDLKFTVTGSIPSGSGVRKYYRAVVDPTAHFMAAWEDMEDSVGIDVTGTHRRGDTPERADLVLQLQSPPLPSILMDMNKHSNNYMAELVLRTTGAEVYGEGTTEAGLAAIRDYLTELGIPEDEYTLVNGSGLSRDIYLRPSHLNAVLLDMASDRRVGSEFRTSLAIAGEDGTLWHRLSDQPGRLRGKTGTLDGVHCLVGYVEAGDGDLYAFAFLVNHNNRGSSAVKKLHDRFARRMFALNSRATDGTAGGED